MPGEDPLKGCDNLKDLIKDLEKPLPKVDLLLDLQKKKKVQLEKDYPKNLTIAEMQKDLGGDLPPKSNIEFWETIRKAIEQGYYNYQRTTDFLKVTTIPLDPKDRSHMQSHPGFVLINYSAQKFAYFELAAAAKSPSSTPKFSAGDVAEELKKLADIPTMQNFLSDKLGIVPFNESILEKPDFDLKDIKPFTSKAERDLKTTLAILHEYDFDTSELDVDFEGLTTDLNEIINFKIHDNWEEPAQLIRMHIVPTGEQILKNIDKLVVVAQKNNLLFVLAVLAVQKIIIKSLIDLAKAVAVKITPKKPEKAVH